MATKRGRRVNSAADNKFKMVIIILLAVLLILALFTFVIVVLTDDKSTNGNTVTPEIQTDVPPVDDTIMDSRLRKTWLTNKNINEDYIGELFFDSGLINVSFVQAKDVYKKNGELYTFYTEDGVLVENPEGYTGNDVYIWTNWKTQEYDRTDEGGSVFMDYRNEIDDQNLIIYGHHFARDWDPEGLKQFTPLDYLLQEEYYEPNKTLQIVLDNEIRKYVVTNVYIISVYNEDDVQILRTNMDVDLYGESDPGFLEGYIDYIEESSRYQTSEKLDGDDKLLTLVTCIQHQPQYRQITLCKEVDRIIYDN